MVLWTDLSSCDLLVRPGKRRPYFHFAYVETVVAPIESAYLLLLVIIYNGIQSMEIHMKALITDMPDAHEEVWLHLLFENLT